MITPSQNERCSSALFQNLECLADTPDAVPKLRSLILDLAIRGALVLQNPDDSPATNLVKTAKFQTNEQHQPQRASYGNASTQQPRFALPQGWCWTCLDDLGDTAPRNEVADKTEVGFSPMRLVTAKFGDPITFDRRPWAEVRKGFTHFADGDVVLAKITPCFENGKSGVIRAAPNGFGAGTTELHVLRPKPECVLAEYVLIFLKSPHFLLNGEAHMTGSAGQKRVPWNYFARTAFPLPPLPEQHRIVAKVEELLALCDELETRQTTARESRESLVHSSLDRLTVCKTDQDFRNRASFILQDSPFILEDVSALRQAILSLAMQGKLVPQNSEEAADNDAATRPPQAPATTIDNDLSFALPSNWQRVLLGEVSELINGDRSKNYPNKVEYVREGVPWINTGHIEPDGTLDLNSMHYITRRKFDSLRSGKVQPGDLVYCLRGATLGKTAIITQLREGAVASSLVIIRLSKALDPRFAFRFLTSPPGRAQIFKFDNGSAQPNLSANSVSKYWIPIPPLAEQARIIAKVDELMRWCDQLQNHLAIAQTAAAHLLDAALHHILLQNGKT
jgi:type I restriction enzyme S subunit